MRNRERFKEEAAKELGFESWHKLIIFNIKNPFTTVQKQAEVIIARKESELLNNNTQ